MTVMKKLLYIFPMFSITTAMSSSYSDSYSYYDDGCDDSTSIMRSSEGLSFINALNELVINSNQDEFDQHKNALDVFYGGYGDQRNAKKALNWLKTNAQKDANFNTVVEMIEKKLEEQTHHNNTQHTYQNSNQFGNTGSKKYTTEIEVIPPASTAIQTVETRSQEWPQIVKLNIFEQSVEANQTALDILLRDDQSICNYDLQSIIQFLISPTGDCSSNRIFSNFFSIQDYYNTGISLYDSDIGQIALAIHKTFGYRAVDRLVNLKKLILSLIHRNTQESSLEGLIEVFEKFISAIQNDYTIEIKEYLSVQQQIQKCLSPEIKYLLGTFMKEIEDLINGYNSFHTVNRVTWIYSAPTKNTGNYQQEMKMIESSTPKPPSTEMIEQEMNVKSPRFNSEKQENRQMFAVENEMKRLPSIEVIEVEEDTTESEKSKASSYQPRKDEEYQTQMNYTEEIYNLPVENINYFAYLYAAFSHGLTGNVKEEFSKIVSKLDAIINDLKEESSTFGDVTSNYSDGGFIGLLANLALNRIHENRDNRELQVIDTVTEIIVYCLHHENPTIQKIALNLLFTIKFLNQQIGNQDDQDIETMLITRSFSAEKANNISPKISGIIKRYKSLGNKKTVEEFAQMLPKNLTNTTYDNVENSFDEQKQEQGTMNLIKTILAYEGDLSQIDTQLEELFTKAIQKGADDATTSKAESTLSVVRKYAEERHNDEIVGYINKLFDKIANPSKDFDQSIIGKILIFINEHIIQSEHESTSTNDDFIF